MYIRFQVKSRIQKQAKMFRNVLRTCWNKYEDELEQKLNEQILPPVPVPSLKENIDVLANKVHLVITTSHEAASIYDIRAQTKGRSNQSSQTPTSAYFFSQVEESIAGRMQMEALFGIFLAFADSFSFILLINNTSHF